MAGENTPPPGLTPEQLTEWANENVGKLVNNMLTARLGTFEKKVVGTITEQLGKTLDEKLTALRAAPPKPDDEPDGKGKNKDDEPDGKGKNKGEFASLRAELNALRARHEETERDRQALLQRQREMALRSDVGRILGAAGITGDRFEAAYALLVQSGRVKPSEDPSSIEGVFSDPVAGGDIPLEQGLAQWLKGETAKIFLPPSGLRGSGGRPPGAPNGSKPVTDGDRRSIVAARLVEELGK